MAAVLRPLFHISRPFIRRIGSSPTPTVNALQKQIESLRQRLEEANLEIQALQGPPESIPDPHVSETIYEADVPEYNELPTFPERPSFKDFQNALKPASQCVVFDGCPDDPHHPSSTPIYQTSTFVQPSATEFGPYDYTRSGNPTRTALEKHIAMLGRAHAGFAFTSGMTALMAMTRIMPQGSELLLGSDIYGGMHRLIMNSTKLHDITVKIVDTTDVAAVEAAITPKTALLHMESPSNPMMLVSDIPALADVLHRNNVMLSIDSTMMPPLLQRPLELGADVEIHSLTKFFSGHADVMGGAVLVNTDDLAKTIAFYQNAEGTALAPFDCWLFLRGIKTLHIRLEKSQSNAERIAKFLQDHECVKEVFYPGLEPKESDSEERKRMHRVHFAQASGGGAVMSFLTGDVNFSRRFVDCLRIFKLTVSFGSVNSLCEMPCLMSHASIPEEERTIPSDIIRLSVGIEDVDDLINDLSEAFRLAKYHKPPAPKFDSRFEDLPTIASPE